MKREAGVSVGSGGKRVALVASAGGHWTELERMAPAFAGWDCLCIATTRGLEPPVGNRPVIEVTDGSRDTLPDLLRCAADIWRVFRAFRPELVVTTGAAPGAIALLVGKQLGAATVWIDSIANSGELSLSGRWAKGFADLRLTQWEHLARSGSGLVYLGGVL